ncbi:MAG: DedA family protein, partial [Verrucomicrobiota bacterium]
MKPLIEKALSSLEKPLAMRIFFLISFLESALLPIPIESLSIPLFTARKNPWPIVIWGTVRSVAGGMVGYLIGF